MKPHRTLAFLALLVAQAFVPGWVHASPGDLDPNFGTGGKVTTAISTPDLTGSAVALQSDGTIAVAGESVAASGAGSPGATLPPPLVVTNTNDSGAGSLRQVIID